MPKYVVTYIATADASVVVEADSQEEAWEKAEQEFQPPSLCYSCSRDMNLNDWYPDESEYGTYEID